MFLFNWHKRVLNIWEGGKVKKFLAQNKAMFLMSAISLIEIRAVRAVKICQSTWKVVS